jgi:hypothetical protein
MAGSSLVEPGQDEIAAAIFSRFVAAGVPPDSPCKAGGRGTLGQVEKPTPGYFPVIGFASRLAGS